MAHIGELEARIETFRQALLQGLAPYQAILRSLQTIPGLDETGAALLLVEIGDDMSAFGTPERLASWAGVCPGNNESAGKKKTGKTRKVILTYAAYYVKHPMRRVERNVGYRICSSY